MCERTIAHGELNWRLATERTCALALQPRGNARTVEAVLATARQAHDGVGTLLKRKRPSADAALMHGM